VEQLAAYKTASTIPIVRLERQAGSLVHSGKAVYDFELLSADSSAA
jgi:hypothetical protein